MRGIVAENRIDNGLYVKVEVPFRKRLRFYDVISEDTKVAARDLSKGKSGTGDDKDLINWRQQLHHAFRITALPLELLDTNAIATYIGALSRRQVESLRFNTRVPAEDGLSFDRIVLSWQAFLKKHKKLNKNVRLVIPDSRRLLISSRLFDRKGDGPVVVQEL